MKAWLLRISSMGGGPKTYYEVAYSDEGVANRRAKDLGAEWKSYHPEQFDCEEINKSRVIVDSKVYQLDKKETLDDIRERAIKKLSGEEKKALGIGP